MTYRSDRQITEAIVPIRMFYAAVVTSADLDSDRAQVRDWLEQACTDVLVGVPKDKALSISRRVERICRAVEDPHRREKTSASKFGLCVYYVLATLRDQGFFSVIDDTPLDHAVTALLSPEGSITEAANIAALDASAQKQARRLFDVLQAEGLYRGAEWA